MDWLQRELDVRGWSQSELARRIRLSSGSMSLLMNGQRNPGPDVSRRIARALGIPETVVFEAAGLINQPRSSTEITLRELYELLKDLPVADQRAILAEARERWESVHSTPAPGPAPEPAAN